MNATQEMEKTVASDNRQRLLRLIGEMCGRGNPIKETARATNEEPIHGKQWRFYRQAGHFKEQFSRSRANTFTSIANTWEVPLESNETGSKVGYKSPEVWRSGPPRRTSLTFTM